MLAINKAGDIIFVPIAHPGLRRHTKVSKHGVPVLCG